MLSNYKRLTIFDIIEFAQVKEINVNADQMKLVSNDFLALYDSTSRKIYLFGQSDDFTLEKEINLANKIETGLWLASDKTRSLSFYNQTQLKYFDFD